MKLSLNISGGDLKPTKFDGSSRKILKIEVFRSQGVRPRHYKKCEIMFSSLISICLLLYFRKSTKHLSRTIQNDLVFI